MVDSLHVVEVNQTDLVEVVDAPVDDREQQVLLVKSLLLVLEEMRPNNFLD